MVFNKYLINNFKLEGECAYIAVSKKTLDELQGVKNDCSGFSKSLVKYKEVSYSFSLIEEEAGTFSLSMRSKLNYNIRIIAEKLGGGGHICAAGATFKAKNVDQAVKMVLTTIKENKDLMKINSQ